MSKTGRSYPTICKPGDHIAMGGWNMWAGHPAPEICHWIYWVLSVSWAEGFRRTDTEVQVCERVYFGGIWGFSWRWRGNCLDLGERRLYATTRNAAESQTHYEPIRENIFKKACFKFEAGFKAFFLRSPSTSYLKMALGYRYRNQIGVRLGQKRLAHRQWCGSFDFFVLL